MKRLCLAALCLAAASSCGVHAQGAAPMSAPSAEPAPSPPLLAPRLPDWCQWTVDYTYPAGDPEKTHASRVEAYNKLAAQDPTLAGAMANPQFLFALDAPRPLRKIVVKTAAIQHEVQSLERGFQSERWTMGQTVVEQTPDSPKLITHMEDPDSNGAFPEFGWISVANFKGRKKLGGVDCLIFQGTLNPLAVTHPEQFGTDQKSASHGGGPGGKDAGLVEATAVIADQTRLPVALQIPTESRRYTFLSAPTQMLSAPPAFIAAAREAEARLNAATKPLSPP